MTVITVEKLKMEKHLTVSDAARVLSTRSGVAISPKAITELFYRRRLDDAACPIVGGRRLIPSTYLSAVEQALHRFGHLPGTTNL